MAFPVDFGAKNKILELTTNESKPMIDNIYKETLRELLNVFGNIFYIDGNSNRKQVTCVHGDQERVAGKLKQDNTLVLPIISVSEKSTMIAEERQRYSNVLVQDKSWDPIKQRATRVLSLAPRAVNIVYDISVWSKYKADIDMIRSAIFTMFNPSLNLRTKFSDYTKVFIENGDEDIGDSRAQDTDDRILQKSISLVAETYIPMPKFTYSNTGKIERFNQDYELFEIRDNMLSSVPAERISVSSNI